MAKSVLFMSMSLDGFIAGPNETDENGLGDGGGRLHEWVFPPEEGGVNQRIHDEFMSTGVQSSRAAGPLSNPQEAGAVITTMGVPIWVLSRRPAPSWAAGWSAVHYLNDVEVAMREAKSAAGERNVLVHGASTAQRAIAAGVLDELEIHLIPVLLGDGRRLFEHLGAEQRELERIRVLAGGGRRHAPAL